MPRSPPSSACGAVAAALPRAVARGPGQRSAPVVILQIGDSHTANDSFSGRMRELFQARFGDAGRGVLPPGVPYPLLPAGARVGLLAGLDAWSAASAAIPDRSGSPACGSMRTAGGDDTVGR